MRQEILPVWIGARRTKMLRLVGRKGDGWLLFLSWVGECLGRGNRVIDEAAEESGRAGLRNRAAVVRG
jgi:alkanesulfonate monooxygenase SsuD/methylene tetrahydromethanopterin reductase-like flavin-dependent oxidoreductase (luciferase family)